MNKRLKLCLGLAVIALSLPAAAFIYREKVLYPVYSPLDFLEKAAEQCDHQPGYAVDIKDGNGNLISKTSRDVAVGDEIIDSDGRHFRVTGVRGKEATAKFLQVDKQFLAYQELFSSLEVPVAAAAGGKNDLVGIYHTHSDESYVPSDGTEAIPFKGGIYQVGQNLVNKLRNENLKVDYDKTPHDPHDNNAYYRSRRTAIRLMKSNPVAMIDVHRDGIPDASYYSKTISNTDVAQLRLVIGRQNPNMSANLDFAKKMMAYSNKTHPKIVKEIFIGRGNYNQDLMPTSILIEAGTHVNSKKEAENGVALFADSIPAVLGITTGVSPTGKVGTGSSGGSWKALAWILGLTILGGGAFLLISSGGVKQARSRLSSYIGREFTGFMGPVGGVRKIFQKTEEKKPDQTDSEFDPDKNEIDRDNLKKTR
ncbi:MAG: stage II sporulation protein P [Actinobacteria bacterium]|nr:stage II sporulation protein P [Actinomycetota bacterium]